MAGIIISARATAEDRIKGRLAVDLAALFGPHLVAVDSPAPLGCDFSDLVHLMVVAADALVVVVDRRWAAFSDEGYGAQLWDPTDAVRNLIEAAFAQAKPVLVLLLDGAPMPPADALPVSIQRLTRCHSQRLDERRWDTQIEDLADRLRADCPGLAAEITEAPDAGASIVDLQQWFVEEVRLNADSRRRPRIARPRLPPSGLQRSSMVLAGVARWFLVAVVLLSAVYLGVSKFASPAAQAALDRLIESVGRLWALTPF